MCTETLWTPWLLLASPAPDLAFKRAERGESPCCKVSRGLVDISLPCKPGGQVQCFQTEAVLGDRARATQCHLALLGRERDLIQVKCD